MILINYLIKIINLSVDESSGFRWVLLLTEPICWMLDFVVPSELRVSSFLLSLCWSTVEARFRDWLSYRLIFRFYYTFLVIFRDPNIFCCWFPFYLWGIVVLFSFIGIWVKVRDRLDRQHLLLGLSSCCFRLQYWLLDLRAGLSLFLWVNAADYLLVGQLWSWYIYL